MPLVSVILPTVARNASGYLRNAIESVLAQDMTDFELFVVDDGSVDGSADTIAEFVAKDSRVHHIRFEENVGLPALTGGHAFKQSKGQFIAWQFDDCIWQPDLLSSLLEVATNKPNVGLVYGQAKLNTHDSSYILGEAFNQATLLERNIIPNCAILTRREVFDKAGWFDPSVILKRLCDHDMWIRASKHFEFAFLEKVVAIENGLTLNDSLGNSVTLIYPLVYKYWEKDRAKYLQIENIDHWNPFAADDWMNACEREQLAELTFEHLLRIKKYTRAVSTVCDILPTKFRNGAFVQASGSDNGLTENVFAWYVNKFNETRQIREREINEYISSQHKIIQQLEGKIAGYRPPRYWSALKRRVALLCANLKRVKIL